MLRASKMRKSLFLEALEIDSPADRETFLDRACAGDDGLRAEIDSLLRAHADPPDAVGRLENGCSPTIDTGGPAEGPGTQIGPYKLREQIGEGGFGVVYVAEQIRPLRRKVALKVIKPGMDTKHIVARFEAERQALALMDHHNIARVIDAGATDGGRPYFVMELINGVAITEYCDRGKLTPEERLRLFVDVCRAVQHAHQKGIIHRDIKPSNVLVTLHDGKPVPKVIDFGVAKALSYQLTEGTVYTAMGQLIGTPAYMSPEQAEMSGLDVDTRSDVYSLGVLLYELLTGSTPFDSETLRKAGLEGIRRILQETEPIRPSAQVSTLKDGEHGDSVFDSRRVDARRLEQTLRGDLDWIVMKALQKERNRRYATPSDFGDDIERQLASQPVEAGPPSILYHAQKYAGRHKVMLTAAAVVLLTMFVGTGVSVLYAIQANVARDHAEAAEDLANERLALLQLEQSRLENEKRKLAAAQEQSQRHFTLAKRAVAELIDDVARRRLIAHPELADFRNSLLTTADRFYSDLLRESPDQAALHVARAGVRRSLNRNDAALQDYRQAIKLDPNSFQAHLLLAEFYRNGTTADLQDKDLALKHNKRAVELRPDSSDAWYHLGWVHAQSFHDNMQASRAMFRSAELTSNPTTHHFRRGIALGLAGHHEKAVVAHTEAIQIGPPNCHFYIQRGGCLRALGHLSAAIRDFTRAVELDTYEPHAYYDRAVCLLRTKDYVSAARDLKRVLEVAPGYDVVTITEKLLRDVPLSEDEELIEICNQLVERIAANFQSEEDWYGLAWFLSRANWINAGHSQRMPNALKLQPDDWILLNNYAWHFSLACPDVELRNPRKALKLSRKAAQIPQSDQRSTWNTYGVALYYAGQTEESIEALIRSAGESPTACDAFFLAMSYWRLGYKQQAHEWYNKAVDWMEKYEPQRRQLIRFRAEAKELMGIHAADAVDPLRAQRRPPEERQTKMFDLLVNTGQWERIRIEFGEFSRTPQNVHLWEARGNAFAAEREWARAAEDYAEALRLMTDTDWDRWWGQTAQLSLRIVQTPELYDRIRAIRLDDNFLSTALIRKRCARAEFKLAHDELVELIERCPGDWWARSILAELQCLLDDANGYQRSCEELKAKFSEHEDVRVQIMVACAILLTPDPDRDRIEWMQNVFQEAQPPRQEWKWRLQMASAILAYRQGDLSTSKALLRGFGGATPEMWNRFRLMSTMMWAMIEYREGHRDDALRAYNSVVDSMRSYRKTVDRRQTTLSLESHIDCFLNCEILRREAARLLQLDDSNEKGLLELWSAQEEETAENGR